MNHKIKLLLIKAYLKRGMFKTWRAITYSFHVATIILMGPSLISAALSGGGTIIFPLVILLLVDVPLWGQILGLYLIIPPLYAWSRRPWQ